MLARQRSEGDVGSAGEHAPHRLLGAFRGREDEFHLGVPPPERLAKVAQQIGERQRGGGDPQRADHRAVPRAREPLFQRCQFRHDPGGRLEHHAPRRRRVGPRTRAHQQGLAQFLLQLPNLVAEGRLRHPQQFGRLAEVAGVGNGLQRLQLADIHPGWPRRCGR